MKIRHILGAAAAVCLFQGSPLLANSIPYPVAGTEAAASAFYATGAGNITAYFYASDAGYDSTLGLLVNGVSTGIFGLPNHASSLGDALVLGYANAGDLLTFQLRVLNTNGSWFSDPGLNSDARNHVYSTPFDGIAGVTALPAGIYLGFEDLPFSLSDIDYNDHQFVLANVSAINLPDHGSSLALSFLGFVPLFFFRRFYVGRPGATLPLDER